MENEIVTKYLNKNLTELLPNHFSLFYLDEVEYYCLIIENPKKIHNSEEHYFPDIEYLKQKEFFRGVIETLKKVIGEENNITEYENRDSIHFNFDIYDMRKLETAKTLNDSKP